MGRRDQFGWPRGPILAVLVGVLACWLAPLILYLPSMSEREVEPGARRKAVGAAPIGNFVEWYDFAIYHILPTLGRLKLVDLTPARVQTLYAAKFDAGYALSTRRHVHVTLGKALKQAVKWRYLT